MLTVSESTSPVTLARLPSASEPPASRTPTPPTIVAREPTDTCCRAKTANEGDVTP
jgi:hypothetical protein